MNEKPAEIHQISINTIRMLAIDVVEKANSGHLGMPLGTASLAYVLFTKFLCFNPRNPNWLDRDRFILSVGHGSVLLYILLYLTGYDLSLDELKRFRQLGSKTPGHPEYRHTPGVEATTGLLGHGFAMGVGMAIAERFLAAQFNRPGHEIINHYIYAIVSDGDLMEGVACEAASLAGLLKLGKLIYLYDDNKITIEGATTLTFNEDVVARFKAYGWQVIDGVDGENLELIEQAIKDAKADYLHPSLIICRTCIGYGTPKQNTASVHSGPLGFEAIQATRQYFKWPDRSFYVPIKVLNHMRRALVKGYLLERQWKDRLKIYTEAFPELAFTLTAQIAKKLPEGWELYLPIFESDNYLATRDASGQIINALANILPNMVGGAADLAPSTKTLISMSSNFLGQGDQVTGRNIRFGVREHAMGAIVNGMALHGGIIPYGATFFVFSDFMRPALRLAALMQCHSIFIFSHDSVSVGEDGPTHQPVEQLMSLRLIPGIIILRPADPNETVAAWSIALKCRIPVCLVLTRQKVPILNVKRYPIKEGVAKGAYILSDCNGIPQIIIIGTGSEVHLCLKVQERLLNKGIKVRVVSMPSWELFDIQDDAYKELVLPSIVKARLAVEAGCSLGWERWVGEFGIIIGLDRFGFSAPGSIAMDKLGFSVDNIIEKALNLI